MLAEKPRIKRILVTARDQDTGENESVTVYETTPGQVIKAIRKLAKDDKGNSVASDAKEPTKVHA